MLKSMLVAGLLLIAAVVGATAQTSLIQVDHAWARATPGGAKTAAVYLTLHNSGAVDDRLISVSTSMAEKAELHTTANDNGVMRMRSVAALNVKAGVPIELKPGGYHIMLLDLKGPLVAGQSFPLSLTFDKAGKVEVMAVVEKVGATGPDSMPGMKM
jgi:copper(I)-binding protein